MSSVSNASAQPRAAARANEEYLRNEMPLVGFDQPIDTPPESGRWTVERAAHWYAAMPWLVGCNFTPSYAINQLEFWQEETFDLSVIDRELGWAAHLGMNAVRVYLHDLLWDADPIGFVRRIDAFLATAA